MPVITCFIDNLDELVADGRHHVEYALVADKRVAVQVDPVEDREAEPEQGYLGVAGDELAMGVADNGIHRIGHDQASQVPEILVDVNLGIFAVRGGIEKRLDFLLHFLVPLLQRIWYGLAPISSRKDMYPSR